jgi:TPR repeat protein
VLGSFPVKIPDRRSYFKRNQSIDAIVSSVWSSSIDDYLAKQNLSVWAVRQSHIPSRFPMSPVDIDFLRSGAEQNNITAQCEHARRLPRDGNVPGAARSFKLAANRVSVTGQYSYGVCLLNGSGISMNRLEASEYFNLTADQGFINTQYSYALCLLNGYGVFMN